MDAINPRALYAIEPQAERFSRWIAETTRWAIRLYWDLFVALPTTIIMMGMALICLGVGLMDLIKYPSNACADLLMISVSAAFMLFQRMRAFAWAFMACCTVWWIVLVTALLNPVMGENYKAASPTANIAILLLDLIPPLVAAAFIDRAKHRKP